MNCRRCGNRAVINMRHHKLALCAEHYLDWLPAQVSRALEMYGMLTPDDRLLVAVSGGKDSLALWDILSRLGLHPDGLFIDLGIEAPDGYSSHSRRLAQRFAESHGLQLIVVDVAQELGASIPQAVSLTQRGWGKPCSVCGLTKRHIMNRIALDQGYPVLATGHNLDDEAAVLFGNTMNWSTGYLSRQGPVLNAAPGLVRKIKPFCRTYERETAAYAVLRGIEYVYEECPHAAGSTSLYFKDVLNRMEEERPGIKLSFYLSFLQARRAGLLAPAGAAQELHPCAVCGQPTSAPDTCSFCRTWALVRQHRSRTA
jgi:uncharacterized protein (TIGR00269 family)